MEVRTLSDNEMVRNITFVPIDVLLTRSGYDEYAFALKASEDAISDWRKKEGEKYREIIGTRNRYECVVFNKGKIIGINLINEFRAKKTND